MAKKDITQRKRLAALFASFTILIMGTVSLSESMSIDYYSVVYTLYKIIPAAIIIGLLGWVMGMILDKPVNKVSNKGYNDSFINNIIKQAQDADTSLEDLDVNTLAPETSENIVNKK